MGLELKRNPMKPLSIFTLTMINVIAIGNLRGLTAGAEYGLALVFFYLLAALLFFLPTILVTAELATGWPNTGGAYVWVREAFGSRVGFFTIWLQWIYNVVWYPTIFSFIAGVLAYIISPDLVHNKLYMVSVTLSTFWLMTLINGLGLRAAGWLSIVGAIIGTLFPMILISGLGFLWIYLGKPTEVSFNVHHFFPNKTDLTELAFFTNVLFGLMGMEMSAVHAGDVHNPTRNYPRALLYSALIILFTLISACLAIVIVIPVKQLSLVSGVMDAFTVFFNAFGMQWFIPVIALLIVLGSLGGAAAWIMGCARGLWVAGDENHLPSFLLRCNKKNMPIGILLTQGVIVTVLTLVFLIMPTVNGSYWVLSNLTAQLALLFYIILFAAAIRLHHKQPHVKRAYRIPGGRFGIWGVCGIGILTSLFAMMVGFIPPTQVAIGNIVIYESILIGGIVICCLPAFVLYAIKFKVKRKNKGTLCS
jgi:amino acid transporter